MASSGKAEIRLVPSMKVHLRRPTSDGFEISGPFNATDIRPDPHNAIEKLNDLILRISSLAQSSNYAITLKLFNRGPESKNAKNKKNDLNLMAVSINSTLLCEIQCLLHQGDVQKTLKLRFEAKIVRQPYRHASFSSTTIYDVITSNFLPLVDDPVLGGGGYSASAHKIYSDLNVKAPEGLFETLRHQNHQSEKSSNFNRLASSWMVQISLTLEVDLNDFIPVEGLLADLLTFNCNLYNDKESCDVTIITKEGPVPCHKMFLTGHSSVFRANLKESKTNTIEIGDMSRDGVIAFLEYLYFRGLSLIKKELRIALEVFQAAEKYHVEPLKQTLISLFLVKPLEWYNLDSALYLYLFVRNLTGMDNLKTKIFDIIVMKKNDLEKSVLFTDKTFSKGVCLELMLMSLRKQQTPVAFSHHQLQCEAAQSPAHWPLQLDGSDSEDRSDDISNMFQM